MTSSEFFAWFHKKYLPLIYTHTHGDVRYYRDMVVEIMSFMTQTGNCYSNLNYACMLAAWANEQFLSTLAKFADKCEYPNGEHLAYWTTHKDKYGILPQEGDDY